MPATPQFGLPRTARLRTQRDFRRVYRAGARARGKNLVVVGYRRRDDHHRLGVSVSKAHGAAPRRNKIKRLLREAFRLERPTLAGPFDLILIPQPRERYHLDEVRRELREAVRRLTEQPRPKRRKRRRT